MKCNRNQEDLKWFASLIGVGVLMLAVIANAQAIVYLGLFMKWNFQKDLIYCLQKGNQCPFGGVSQV
jgi:hypothetical protein